eukprot:7112288-Pyramimonas_sp.AAC.2
MIAQSGRSSVGLAGPPPTGPAPNCRPEVQAVSGQSRTSVSLGVSLDDCTTCAVFQASCRRGGVERMPVPLAPAL